MRHPSTLGRVSDVPGGPGWWQASDGKWYPPQPPPVAPPPAPGQLTVTPSSYVGDASVARRTNGLAIASLVCSIGGLLVPLGGVLGIIFGFVARNQIRRSNSTQGGAGLALAGIIVGFAEILIYAVVLVDVISSHTAT